MTLVCENGHVFQKSLKRYADLFCPECGTKEVFRIHPDDDTEDPYAVDEEALS